MSLNVLTVSLLYDKKCVYILPLMITTGKKIHLIGKGKTIQYVSHKYVLLW
jgi:hypothetical protein